MTKETSEEIAKLAAKYIDCPDFDLRLLFANGSKELICGEHIRSLAASCLAQRETVEPSVPTSKLLTLLGLRDRTNLVMGLQDLIGEAEKEAEK